MRKEVGEVTILVNNAGLLSIGEFMTISDERIQKINEVNVLSHFWVSNLVSLMNRVNMLTIYISA